VEHPQVEGAGRPEGGDDLLHAVAVEVGGDDPLEVGVGPLARRVGAAHPVRIDDVEPAHRPLEAEVQLGAAVAVGVDDAAGKRVDGAGKRASGGSGRVTSISRPSSPRRVSAHGAAPWIR
jgi:hypothetical protein